MDTSHVQGMVLLRYCEERLNSWMSLVKKKVFFKKNTSHFFKEQRRFDVVDISHLIREKCDADPINPDPAMLSIGETY